MDDLAPDYHPRALCAIFVLIGLIERVLWRAFCSWSADSAVAHAAIATNRMVCNVSIAPIFSVAYNADHKCKRAQTGEGAESSAR